MSTNRVEAEPVTKKETSGSWRLWFGILAGPLAWAVHIVVAPDLNEVLCYPGAGAERGHVLGIGTDTFLIGFTIVLALVTATGFLTAFSCARKIRNGNGELSTVRASWMARAGMIVSLLFFVGIVVNFAPLAVLSTCRAPL